MNSLFKKPSNMRWVDLAIWVDENFYKEDCDYNTAYSYMYLLASMLASKHRYFDNQRDYEEFASYLAYDTYKRMSDTSKVPIKSVLNYMKSVISFRRMMFNHQRRQKIIDPKFDTEWDPSTYVEKCKESYEATFSEDLYKGVCEVLAQIPAYILKSIPKVYKADKLLYKNIYLSCMLSMINRITLPNIINNKLEARLNESPTFNEVKYYTKYLDQEIILWHIPEALGIIIVTILNKVNAILIDEIKGLSNDIKVSNEEFNNIMFSGLSGGNKNETDY